MSRFILGKEDAEKLFSEIRKYAESRGISTLEAAGSMPSNIFSMSAEEIRKKATTGYAVTAQTSRMAPFLWAPDMQISSFVLPKTIEEKNRFRRFYYAHDPIVGTAIDLHTRFPLSTFRLICEEDEFGEIADEYEEIAQDIDLYQVILDIGKEYWLSGEAFPYGVWNEEDLQWDSFLLMDPNYLAVDKNPFSAKDVFICINTWNPYLRKVVRNGPNDPRTGHIYRHMMETASDVVEKIKSNEPYQLDPRVSSHVARKVNYFDIRGVSIIDRIFKVLMYQDKLQAAQLAIADRHITPIEIWTVGNDENPPDEEALANLDATIKSMWQSPQKAIIWNHTLKGEFIGASGVTMPLSGEWDWIDKQKFIGLMVNNAILTAEGPTYASASVASDFLASWYMSYRQTLERWIIHHVFDRVARERGYWKPVKRHITGYYRVKSNRRRPILPKVLWDKANLRDDFQKLQTLINLANNGKVPFKIIYEMLNLDRDTMIKEIEKEMKMFQSIAPSMPAAQAAGGLPSFEETLGAAGAPLGGGGAEGANLIMPEQNLPSAAEGSIENFNEMGAFGEGSPGGMMPAESFGFPSDNQGGTGV